MPLWLVGWWLWRTYLLYVNEIKLFSSIFCESSWCPLVKVTPGIDFKLEKKYFNFRVHCAFDNILKLNSCSRAGLSDILHVPWRNKKSEQQYQILPGIIFFYLVEDSSKKGLHF